MLVVLKVVIAPLLILACTLAARRWGTAVGGWMLGLPLTSGPVSVLLFLERGPSFARHAAGGTLLGLAVGATFCACYLLLANRHPWWRALPIAIAAAGVAAALLMGMHPSFAWSAAIAFGVLTVLAMTMSAPRAETSHRSPGHRDLLMRIALASTLVYLVSTSASLLGPLVAGLLAPLPLLSGIMAASVHRNSGRAVADTLLRGTLMGSWGGATFFLVVGLMMASGNAITTYAIATTAALLVAAAVGRAQPVFAARFAAVTA